MTRRGDRRVRPAGRSAPPQDRCRARRPPRTARAATAALRRTTLAGWTTVLLGAALAGCATARPGTGCAAGAACPQAGGPPTIVLTIHHSRFSPAELTVRAGSRVRFVVRNTDPIDHELIVGGAGVPPRHERGTQAHHDLGVPGEVSVLAGTDASTAYTFGSPGTIEFACHLPGHYAYGMRGPIHVVP